MEWRPIESAPRDVRGLLWCTDAHKDWATGKWAPKGSVMGRVTGYPDGDFKAYGEGLNGDWTFTHWMPLPPPPTA